MSIHINKGYQLLDGEAAMGVIRYRHDNRKNGIMPGYANGDLGRIETQQAFLKAVVEQLLKVQNVTKINKFSKIFQESVETDLSFQNIFWFAKSAVMGGLTPENVNFVTMPNKNTSCWSRTYHNYQSYVTPIASDLLTLVNGSLSPFVDQFTLSDLDIMSVNSDGSVSSTTGRVEDSKAAQPPQIPSNTPETPVDNEPVDEPVIPPAEEETVPPTEGETTPPTEGETAPPTGSETTPPAAEGTVPPGEEGTVLPTEPAIPAAQEPADD